MLSDILTNKWILGCIALLIVVAASCYFWYQHETSPYEKEAAKTAELVRQMEISKVDTDNLTEDETKTSINSVLTDGGKVSDADIETLLEWIGAEEEEVKKALSAEELRKQEAKKRSRELFKEIGAIMKGAGGKIHSSTHPEEWRKISQLLQEASGGGVTMFTQMNDFAMRFQNSVNSQGEMHVSEAIKMADYMESENSDTFSATALRNLVEYTVNNGDDVIKLNELHKIDISGKSTDNKDRK